MHTFCIHFIALIYFSRVNFKLNKNKSTKKRFLNEWWIVVDASFFVCSYIYMICNDNNGLIK